MPKVRNDEQKKASAKRQQQYTDSKRERMGEDVYLVEKAKYQRDRYWRNKGTANVNSTKPHAVRKRAQRAALKKREAEITATHRSSTLDFASNTIANNTNNSNNTTTTTSSTTTYTKTNVLQRTHYDTDTAADYMSNTSTHTIIDTVLKTSSNRPILTVSYPGTACTIANTRSNDIASATATLTSAIAAKSTESVDTTNTNARTTYASRNTTRASSNNNNNNNASTRNTTTGTTAVTTNTNPSVILNNDIMDLVSVSSSIVNNTNNCNTTTTTTTSATTKKKTKKTKTNVTAAPTDYAMIIVINFGCYVL